MGHGNANKTGMLSTSKNNVIRYKRQNKGKLLEMYLRRNWTTFTLVDVDQASCLFHHGIKERLHTSESKRWCQEEGKSYARIKWKKMIDYLYRMLNTMTEKAWNYGYMCVKLFTSLRARELDRAGNRNGYKPQEMLTSLSDCISQCSVAIKRHHDRKNSYKGKRLIGAGLEIK